MIQGNMRKNCGKFIRKSTTKTTKTVLFFKMMNLDRGYENIEENFKNLGAVIKRV